MSAITVCDHCGQPIGDDDLRVNVRVEDSMLGLLTVAMKQRRSKKDWTPPEALAFKLDLHRACYLEHYRAAIQRTAADS